MYMILILFCPIMHSHKMVNTGFSLKFPLRKTNSGQIILYPYPAPGHNCEWFELNLCKLDAPYGKKTIIDFSERGVCVCVA